MAGFRVTFPGLLSLNHLIETAAVDDDGLACNDGESQANGAGVIDISPDNSPGAASSPSHMEQDDEGLCRHRIQVSICQLMYKWNDGVLGLFCAHCLG